MKMDLEGYFYRLTGFLPSGMAYHLDLIWSLDPRDYWMTIFRCIRDWWRVMFIEHCLCIAYHLGLTRELPYSIGLEEYERKLDENCSLMLREATRKQATTIRFAHSPSNRIVNIEFFVSDKYEHYRAMKQSGNMLECTGGDMITWMKLQANLDITETRVAQWGQFSYAPLGICLLVKIMPRALGCGDDAIVQIEYRSESGSSAMTGSGE